MSNKINQFPVAAPLSPTGAKLRPEWSLALVVDVALGVSEDSILEAHGLVKHQLDRIMEDPHFAVKVGELRKNLEKEGASFKLKCQLQADDYLSDVYTMVKDKDMDPRVRTRLIENVARWAGFDAPAPVGGAGGGGFSISINLGSSQQPRGITVDGIKDVN